MSEPTKRRPAGAPALADSPAPPTESPVAPARVYKGDVYGLMIWFGGATILVLLHVIDAVYWWVKR